MGAGVPEKMEPVDILLVDDRPENLIALEAILQRPDYRLAKATSGEEALKALLQRDFALILLDLFMPGMTGVEVARAVKQRERTRDIPIIFLTASGLQEGHSTQAYLVGAADYLSKPVDPVIVRAKVAVFADLFRKNRLIRQQAEALRRMERQERESQVAELRRASEERYRNLAEAIPAIVWIGEAPDGRVTYWNRTWFTYSGLSEAQSMGEGWREAMHPQDRGREQERFQQAVREVRPYQGEARFRRHDGVYRWHLCRAVPERDHEGRLVAWLGTNTDIDDQKRAGAERERLLALERAARTEAEAANRTKDEFLATVSHELRTPLTSLLGWTRLLRSRKVSPAQWGHALEVIERSALAQARLVEDILDVSRIVSGKLRLEVQPVDLAEVVRSAAETVRLAAEAKRQQLHLELAPGLEPLQGDPNRLRQVVWNLLSNAIKFTPEGGVIRVRLRQQGGRARLEVQDTGIGIPGEFLPEVFQRFHQANGRSTRAHGGLGLGLAITRHLVELHGGSVQAESPGPGQGATFSVELPLGARPARPGGRRPPDGVTRLDGLSVLLVEDADDAREVLASALTHQGARVTAVRTAGEALAALEQVRPDVLVSDILLPGQDGYALLREVRRRPGGALPAAALTAFAGEGDRAQAMAAGFQAHVSKPVDPDALAAVVGRLAAQRDQAEAGEPAPGP